MAATIAFSGAGVAAAAPLASNPSVSVMVAKKAAAVTINKISNKTVVETAKVTIKPSVKAAKGVKVTKKLLTVKQGKKTVAKNKASAALRAGTYKVTTAVNYTVGKKKLKVSKTQTLVVKKVAAITFNKISNKTVKGSAKVTIKPSIKAAKGVKVTKKLLTVKQGKKTVAKNKASVALRAGTYKVTTAVNYTVGKKKSKVSKTQTLVVKKAAAKKSWAAPKGKSCPSGFPVKGNQTGSNSEWKYHVKGGQYYDRTAPEQCFKTTADARKAGYRASKR